MSIKVTARVWEHSRHRGTIKLLLLALAEFANDGGICWPGAAKLAKYINENERYTRALIKKLIEAGDLFAVPGGGRGNTTIYGVAVGLNTRQREQLNSELQNTVAKSTDNEKTVYCGVENSVLQLQKTVFYSSGDEAPIAAYQSDKTPQNQNDNRHVDPSVDPRESEREHPPAPAPLSEHPAVALYVSMTGVTPTGFSVEMIASRVTDLARWGKAIKDWLGSGFKPGNVTGMLDWYHGRGKHQQNGQSTQARPPPPPIKPVTDALTREQLAEMAKNSRKHHDTS